MNNANHLVSVIMSVFNGGDFFPVALESVRKQDYPNLEIIVVNDGSTDKTDEVLASFSDSWIGRMKVLTHPNRQRLGIVESYKLGLENCDGKYIAFLEHDDVWSKNKISKQTKVFDTFSEVGVVISDVYTCDEEGRIGFRPFKASIIRPPTDRPFDAFWRLLWKNFILTFSNIMVRHDLISASDILSDSVGFQDWMLLLQLSTRCKFYHCIGAKTFWRKHPDSYMGKLRQLPDYTPIYRRLRKQALKRAVAKILQQKQSLRYHHIYIEFFLKKYWYLVVYILSAAERIPGLLSRRDLTEDLRKPYPKRFL